MTQIQPTLAQMMIYPIKSLDGIEVTRAQISAGGTLLSDRRWAIVDDDGKIVNAKRTAKIHQLSCRFNFSDLATESAQPQSISIYTSLQGRGSANDNRVPHTFSLATERPQLAKWLSDFFGFSVSLIEDSVRGFPDDLAAYGPTIVSTATLETICTWFPALNLAEVRRRFRTNLEISGVPAFWEDRLFAAPGEVVNFQLGEIRFYGINPCQRCIVPTRNSLTGDILPKFQQVFTRQRQQTLPSEVNAARFDHFYRLAVNTQIPVSEVGKFLNIGNLLIIDS